MSHGACLHARSSASSQREGRTAFPKPDDPGDTDPSVPLDFRGEKIIKQNTVQKNKTKTKKQQKEKK